MQTIRKDMAVSIDYTLTDDAGKVLDSSSGEGPLTYLHGHQAIIAGLEAALEGRKPGDQLQATVQPTDAYGRYDKALVQTVPRQTFPSEQPITVGQHFRAEHQGGVHVVRVVAVDEQNVTVDGNHPLAGQTLHFDVIIRDVHAPTDEEIRQLKNED